MVGMTLSEMSDKELAALAANDNQEAFACLLGRYSSLIHAKAVVKSRMCGCDIVDDLSQEAAIGFLKAVRSYDDSKGAEFRTYVEKCVENVLVSAVRSYVSLKNLPLNDHEEFSDSEILGNAVSYGFSGTLFHPEGYLLQGEDSASAVLAGLTELEKSVIEMRVKGFSYEETAARLGISVKSVDNAIQRVRQKIKSRKPD